MVHPLPPGEVPELPSVINPKMTLPPSRQVYWGHRRREYVQFNIPSRKCVAELSKEMLYEGDVFVDK